MAKNTFFSSFKNAKNANFDQLTWTTDCDVIIEHMQNLIISTDSSLNSVSDRVLEHVPKVKTGQNMLIFQFFPIADKCFLSNSVFLFCISFAVYVFLTV